MLGLAKTPKQKALNPETPVSGSVLKRGQDSGNQVILQLVDIDRDIARSLDMSGHGHTVCGLAEHPAAGTSHMRYRYPRVLVMAMVASGGVWIQGFWLEIQGPVLHEFRIPATTATTFVTPSSPKMLCLKSVRDSQSVCSNTGLLSGRLHSPNLLGILLDFSRRFSSSAYSLQVSPHEAPATAAA